MVSRGEEAVEWLRSNKADIIVMDMIMLPGIDGLEAYKMILESNPQQKSIIVRCVFFKASLCLLAAGFPCKKNQRGADQCPEQHQGETEAKCVKSVKLDAVNQLALPVQIENHPHCRL